MGGILTRGFIRRDYLTGVVGTLWALFQVYSTIEGPFNIEVQRTIHLGFALALAFIVFPFSRKGEGLSRKGKVPLLDMVLAALAMAANLYLWSEADRISGRVMFVDDVFQTDRVLGMIDIVLLLEATRRSVGWPLAGLALVAIAYVFTGQYLPGMFNSAQTSFNKFIEYQILSAGGIYGTPLGVSATYAYIFVLFGAFLGATGVGKYFIDAALAFTGRSPGGPAKASVVGSSLVGMVSGSAVANVMTVGVFTIPLMKKCGYSPKFAAGVETAASSGGQIMPPVMGVAAFIMAELTGIPYWQICIAGAIPAVLYYLNMYIMVHLEAVGNGLTGMPASQLPPKRSLIKGAYMLAPLLIMTAALGLGQTPLMAGFWGLVSSIAIAPFSKENRSVITSRNPWHMVKMAAKGLYHAFGTAASPAVIVAVSCAAAGIIVGVFALTGLTMRFSAAAMALSGGNVLVGLLILAVVSGVLGMGVPTSAAYITVAAVIIPTLVWAGLPVIVAHMFALWATSTAAITPPVALAAYAAAPLAGASLWATGIQGCKLGIMMIILPFMFVYHPALLAQGSISDIAATAALAVVATTVIAISMEGWFFRPASITERVLYLAAGLMMFSPDWRFWAGGLVLGALLLAWNRFGARGFRGIGGQADALKTAGKAGSSGEDK